MPEKGKYLTYFSTTKDNSLKNIVILLYFISPQHLKMMLLTKSREALRKVWKRQKRSRKTLKPAIPHPNWRKFWNCIFKLPWCLPRKFRLDISLVIRTRWLQLQHRKPPKCCTKRVLSRLFLLFFLVKIRQDTFFKLEHSEQDPETTLGHFLVEIRLNQTSSYNIKTLNRLVF